MTEAFRPLAAPLFYDLEEVAKGLSGQPAYRPFIEQIRRYRDAMSVQNDLRECQDCLDVLAQQNLNTPSMEHAWQVIISALITRAIVLYVRATKTSSRHRTFVPVRTAMPPDLVPLHERMVSLRDNAIAHFGPGPGGTRPSWAREVVALRLDGDKASLVLPYSRTNIQTDLPSNLRSLLDYAIARVWELAGERADRLLEEVKRLWVSDGSFREILQSSLLDLRGFFNGDEAAVRQAVEADVDAQTLRRPSYVPTEFLC